MTTAFIRAYFTKLTLIVVAMLTINHLAVRPKAHEMGEMMEEYRSQVEFIRAGQVQMKQNDQEIERFRQQVDSTRANILKDLGPDPSLFAHQRLQRYAKAHGLTVTRVEPMRSVIKQTNDDGVLTNPIAIDTKEFRMECHGAFHSVLALIAEIQGGPYNGQVTSFRMVPTNDDAVRVVMQVRLIELKQFPDTNQRDLES